MKTTLSLLLVVPAVVAGLATAAENLTVSDTTATKLALNATKRGDHELATCTSKGDWNLWSWYYQTKSNGPHSSDEDSLSPATPTLTGLPRFRLVLSVLVSGHNAPPDSWVVAAIRAFVGIGDTTERSTSTVQGYVASLLPHVDETKLFEHAVEVCFCLRDLVPRLNLTNAIHALSTEVETRSRETTPAQRKADLVAGAIRFPVVMFKEFALELADPIDSDDVVAELLQIFATAGNIVTVARCYLEPTRDNEQARLDVAGFRTVSPVGNVPDLGMTGLDLSERDVSPMKSVASAHASLYRLYYGEQDDTVPQEDATDPADVHYTVVTVRAGTTCYESASVQDKRLCELNDDTKLTAVVKYAMRDVDQLPTVVCVVVPTRGHGWIPRTSITSLSWLRSSGSSIQHIALRELEWKPSIPFSSFGPLVHNVSSLDLARWGELSASRLLELLRVCPRLKRLHVGHRGDLWHEWDEKTVGDDAALNNLQLQELSMFCRAGSFRAPSKTAWNTCIRRLSSFWIRTFSSTALNQEAVRDAFNQGYTVERFMWHTCSSFNSDSETTYEEGRANTRQLLNITKGKNDKAQLPFSVDARLAFASVIKRKSEEKDDPGEDRRLRPRRTKQQFEGLGKLSPEIARLICEFATTDVERRVWVYC